MSNVHLILIADSHQYRSYDEIELTTTRIEEKKLDTYNKVYIETLNTTLRERGAILGYQNGNLNRLERDTFTRITFRNNSGQIAFRTNMHMPSQDIISYIL